MEFSQLKQNCGFNPFKTVGCFNPGELLELYLSALPFDAVNLFLRPRRPTPASNTFELSLEKTFVLYNNVKQGKNKFGEMILTLC